MLSKEDIEYLLDVLSYKIETFKDEAINFLEDGHDLYECQEFLELYLEDLEKTQYLMRRLYELKGSL